MKIKRIFKSCNFVFRFEFMHKNRHLLDIPQNRKIRVLSLFFALFDTPQKICFIRAVEMQKKVIMFRRHSLL